MQKNLERAEREAHKESRLAFKARWSKEAIRQAGERMQDLVKNPPPPGPCLGRLHRTLPRNSPACLQKQHGSATSNAEGAKIQDRRSTRSPQQYPSSLGSSSESPLHRCIAASPHIRPPAAHARAPSPLHPPSRTPFP